MSKLNDIQESKLKAFTMDVTMSNAVKTVVLESFLKRKSGQDVYQLAASRIAIDLLEDAWKEFDKYNADSEDGNKKGGQVGL